MKRAILERNIVVVLFVMVLVVFSMAQRDSKKLEQLYGTPKEAFQLSPKEKELTGSLQLKRITISTQY